MRQDFLLYQKLKLMPLIQKIMLILFKLISLTIAYYILLKYKALFFPCCRLVVFPSNCLFLSENANYKGIFLMITLFKEYNKTLENFKFRR